TSSTRIAVIRKRARLEPFGTTMTSSSWAWAFDGSGSIEWAAWVSLDIGFGPGKAPQSTTPASTEPEQILNGSPGRRRAPEVLGRAVENLLWLRTYRVSSESRGRSSIPE